MLAADQRRELLAMHGLETALGSTLVEHAPSLNWLGEALELGRAEVDVLEQAAEQVLVPSAMTTLPGSASACSRAARFGVSPTTACSCAAPSPISSPTTTARSQYRPGRPTRCHSPRSVRPPI